MVHRLGLRRPLAPPPDWWTSSGIPPSAVRAAATTTSCRTPRRIADPRRDRLRAPSVTEDSSFLRGANMLFRRSVLEELGGFDEQHYNAPGSPGAEDAEIGYRAIEAGHRLRFVPDSRVGHFHPTRFLRYLRTQRHHGYWRVWLYARHRGWVGGDSYSGLLDHLRSAWALLTSPRSAGTRAAWPIPLLCLAALMAMQVPVTRGLLRRTRRARYGVFVPFGAIRAFARALGMSWGVASVLVMARARRSTRPHGRHGAGRGDRGARTSVRHRHPLRRGPRDFPRHAICVVGGDG
ncbi:MAG: glycosyltransferase family 2 protein [Myxococcota bacterium]